MGGVTGYDLQWYETDTSVDTSRTLGSLYVLFDILISTIGRVGNRVIEAIKEGKL